jgi:hypothetical protein
MIYKREIEMRKCAFVLIAAFVILQPLAALAAPNPKYCLDLRTRFDRCETYQIKHNKPVAPTCTKYLTALKKAGC